ncbi:MAG TPA: stage II sporulation protein M [Hellea balneolensis]|uniref:Stage II sporulation protein M n=1 Tax=Hellea balneolensis TaxID=287478 RepID=A0A7C5QZX3_9PROT|nr:stage II sporulation protein M [Hellea balneolensis]
MASLKSHKFRTEREAAWKQLEVILAKLERRSIKKLTDEEMLALPGLYRSTLSSLSVARSISLDQDVISYLESLSTRTYFAIYGNHTGLFERISYFFRVEWPRSVQRLSRETLFSLFITILSALIAYLLVRDNMDWYFSFIPDGLAGGRTPASTAEELRNTLYHDPNEKSALSVFATYLFSHNSRVAIFAFALGFAFAVPSVLLIMYNGCTLGAFIALFSSKGLGFEVGGWLIIHGATEIFAIILAGAAGMHIGWSVAFPGAHSRMEAASLAGKRSAAVLGGVIIMLFFAGLLEGFGRQLITNDFIRYGIGLSTLVLWCAYFYLPRDFDLLEDEQSVDV